MYKSKQNQHNFVNKQRRWKHVKNEDSENTATKVTVVVAAAVVVLLLLLLVVVDLHSPLLL
jgi:hypothetical protein